MLLPRYWDPPKKIILQRDGVYTSPFAPSSLSRFSARGKINDLDNESGMDEARWQRSMKKRELSTKVRQGSWALRLWAPESSRLPQQYDGDPDMSRV